ncbi:hypothetical protein DXG03_002621, partial [Asterophora parasitica]
SFFGSTPAGISWFADAFYAQHDRYITTTFPTQSMTFHPHAPKAPLFHFVGKDQTLINALVFRHPSRFIGILAPQRSVLLPASLTPDANVVYTQPTPHRPRPYVLSAAYLLARLRARIGGGGHTCAGDWYYYQWWLASEGER